MLTVERPFNLWA